jgi:hypothetical protein
MKKKNLKFQNKRFACGCIKGVCPNYKKEECGQGGEAIFKKKSYDSIFEALKRTLQYDEYIGTKGYYQRSYKKKIQEKRNGK